MLSRELHLYYTRLTSSLLPPTADSAKRTVALASLRNNTGLQALLLCLIRWVGEGVVTAPKEGAQSKADGRSLEVLLDVVSAILENNTLLIEPYVSNPPNPSQLSKLISFVCITCYLVNHSPFHAFTISCHLLAHVRCSDALPSAYATFYHISVPLTTNYEDPSRCFNIIGQIQGHPGRCHSQPRGNRKGGGKERIRGGWRSEICWK